MSELVKCATCKTEKPFSEMQTCMHAEREHSVCDMACMIKFYKGEIKPDIVITPDLEEMVKLGMNPKEYDLYKASLELAKQLAKDNDSYKEIFSAFESCQDELAKANERVKELEENSKDSFVSFAKKHKTVDGSTALFIHALGVAFDKEQLRKEQE